MRDPPPDDIDKSAIHGPEMFAPMIEDEYGMLDAGPEIYGVYDEYGEWGCKCPYGQPGDRLWVRESLYLVDCPTDPYWPRFLYKEEFEFYQNDGWYKKQTDRFWASRLWRGNNDKFGHKSPIHMPRWASRITLEIVNVRMERLQEISEEDAIAEGVMLTFTQTRRAVFKYLWEKIHGPDAWNQNPWVWVIEFKRVDGKECM